MELPPLPPRRDRKSRPEREPRCPRRSLAAGAVSSPGAGPRAAGRHLRPAPPGAPGLPEPESLATSPHRGVLRPFISTARPPPSPPAFCPLTPPRSEVSRTPPSSPAQAGTQQRMLRFAQRTSCGADTFPGKRNGYGLRPPSPCTGLRQLFRPRVPSAHPARVATAHRRAHLPLSLGTHRGRCRSGRPKRATHTFSGCKS